MIETYKKAVDLRLNRSLGNRSPAMVYEPIHYALSAGGKRLRAVLTLLACEAVGGSWKTALDAAVAIEMLHNFTLVHDDIMDKSPLRRGKPAVHRKWDLNTAVLSGDEMVACAYRELLLTPSKRKLEIAKVFTQAFIEVCEGQGYDIEFETRNSVSIKDYLMMIGKKTAYVISAATEMGALAGNGTPKQISALRSFGRHLGMAFQLQDDYLDIHGTTKQLGKAIGGDIAEGKKTFLYISALARLKGTDLREFKTIIRKRSKTARDIQRVHELYKRGGILDAARKEIRRNTVRSLRDLDSLPAGRARAALGWIAGQLADRNS
jgi:geranylgeranyl diphosphate synthase type II